MTFTSRTELIKNVRFGLAHFSRPGGTGGQPPASSSPTSGGVIGAAAAAAAAAQKKNTSRRNAWGNLSYADLITQAIASASDNRLTLSQIYEWMVQNVPYFKDKGDSNSSAGWKVSDPLCLLLLLLRSQRIGGDFLLSEPEPRYRDEMKQKLRTQCANKCVTEIPKSSRRRPRNGRFT